MSRSGTPRDGFRTQFRPVLAEIARRSAVTDRFVDKDVYRIYVATLWANVVMDPADLALAEADLEPVHDYLNEAIAKVLGPGACITECFRFVNSKPGAETMDRCRVAQAHRDLLLYFSSMILDPEGHLRWRESVKAQEPSSRSR